MSSLHELQRRLQQSVLAGDGAALGEVVGDLRADAAARLQVYQHAYRARLAEVVAGEYPGLALLAGAAAGALFEAYVEQVRSHHYNVRWYAQGLAGFLAAAPAWSARPELAAMARFEWALSSAFDAADETLADRGALAGVAPEAWAGLRLRPQAALRELELAWNLDDFRRAADRGEDAAPPLRRHPQPSRWAVWRRELGVHYRALDADEQRLWPAARAGEPLAAWCELLAETHGDEAAIGLVASLLQRWLDEGWVAALEVGQA